MGGYGKTSRGSGSGIFRNLDGSKSIKAFYEYYYSESYIGNRDRVPMPGETVIKVMDCRDKDNKKVEPPGWLRSEAMLEAEDGQSYRVTYGPDGVWHLKPEQGSGGG